MIKVKKHLPPAMAIDRFSHGQIFTSILVVILVTMGIGTSNARNYTNRVQEERDDAFIQAIETGAQASEPVHIRDIVDFEWDDVTLFQKASSQDDLNSIAGEIKIVDHIFSSDSYIFAFRRDLEIVKMFSVSSVRFKGDFNRILDKDAVLTRRGEANGNSFLWLSDPLAQINIWRTLPGTTQIHQGHP